jgi:hypothetical protein
MIFSVLGFITAIFFVWLGIKLLKRKSVYEGAMAIILAIILFVITSPGMLLLGLALLHAIGIIP